MPQLELELSIPYEMSECEIISWTFRYQPACFPLIEFHTFLIVADVDHLKPYVSLAWRKPDPERFVNPDDVHMFCVNYDLSDLIPMLHSMEDDAAELGMWTGMNLREIWKLS